MNPYVIGLDIGIASVGWAALGEQRIVDLGVRCFDKAETAKEGESLNLARRQARLLRRRLYRRAWRLTKLARLLKREGLIDSANFFKAQPGFTDSAWKLRVEGLDRRLTQVEWARVIYHLCKHRGFHWVSKAEEASAEQDAKGEGGRVKKGLADTSARMAAKGYRTAAEMVLTEFPDSQRNKRGDYTKALARKFLDDEFRSLFEAQRRLGNPHACERIELLIRGNGDKRSGPFWSQKPALAGTDLLKMLGHCTFEKDEYRAPKASFTAERHVWLTRLNNLRVVIDGLSRPLKEGERQAVLNLPYLSGEKFTYKHLRSALVKAGMPDSFRFGAIAYPSASQTEEQTAKNPEDQVIVKLSGWHELRLALKKAGLEDAWRQLSVGALEGQPLQLDQVAWVLSVYKDDDEVERELRKLDLPQAESMIAVLQTIRFDKFHALSLMALRHIVPMMERGLRYDEAAAAKYGHHSHFKGTEDSKTRLLPPFYQGRDPKKGTMIFREDLDIPRNPVVLRSLNQARKVLNAIIKRYGSPTAVHIEMARDLSRPLDERREVQKLQEEFRDRNQRLRDDFETLFKRKPNGKDFEKWLLYKEQGGQCAYSLQPLAPSGDCNEIFLEGKTQIDHALPYSRSFDDSRSNKVLVLTRENQNKGNRTPYEYLTSFAGGEDGEHWRNYVAWVGQNKAYRMAKRNRLLRKNYGPEESQGFRDRNLNDTRYICKFFKSYVEQHLHLAARVDRDANRRCVVVNGQLTAFLRARWGLIKVRDESDRHHALDAAVVAACSHGMVKALADHSRLKEVEFLKEGFPDPETGEILNPAAFDRGRQRFPEPWAHFRHELESRLRTDNLVALREDMQRLGTYSDTDLRALRTVFVSRAVQRRGTPSIHESTLRSPKYVDIQKSAVRIPLTKLSLAKLEEIVEGQGRNKPLVDALRKRLADHGNDAAKAFAISFYKPTAAGKVAPLVTSVRLVSTQRTGLRLGHAIAELGEMTGVGVYRLAKGYFLDPLYPAAAAARLNYKNPPPDAKYQFMLTKNDLVEVEIGDEVHRGYFVMYESDGRMTLRAHDQPQPDKKYFRRAIAGAKLISKLNVDALGFIYPPP